MKHQAIKISMTALAAALALVTPVAASATSGQRIASAGSSVTGAPALTTVTLPLFGAPLTIEITTGPGGALASVNVNPADGFTATTLKPNKVTFVNEDGSAKVVVKSRGGGQKVETKAGSLADVSGPGGWSGELFGDGVITTVAFVIGETADGLPDITGVTTDYPDAEIGAVQRSDGDDDEQGAVVKIRFVNGGQSRTLAIRVEQHTDEGEQHAKVSLALSKLRGVPLPASEVAGKHSWKGLLCDGTSAEITFMVAEDGTISEVVTSPDTAEVRTSEGRTDVRFSKNERVKIHVDGHDGELRLSIDEKIRCDAPAPDVNTPVSVPADGTDHAKDGHDRRDGQGKGHDRQRDQQGAPQSSPQGDQQGGDGGHDEG